MRTCEGGFAVGYRCGLVLLVLGLAITAAAAEPVSITGRDLVISLDPAQHYALSELRHRGQQVNFIAPPTGNPREDRSLWQLTIRGADGRLFVLRPAQAQQASHRQQGDILTVTWSNVSSEECPADLQVTARVRLGAAEVKSRWQLEVSGTAPGVLWEVVFPRVPALQPVGEDRLALPIYSGRLVRDPARQPLNLPLNYPSPASMQFGALWGTQDAREPQLTPQEGRQTESGWEVDRSDAAGLYWAAEDGQCYSKTFSFDSMTLKGHFGWSLTHYPGVKTWPLAAGAGSQTVSYKLPYEVAVAAFTGDYHRAAELYHDFARDQFWCSRGPADHWAAAAPPAGSQQLAQWVPTWFRESGFWAKFYHEPAKVLPEWAAYARWLKVPIASHYYRFTIAVFDDNYPEMLPADPYYLAGVRDAKDLGVRPMPYTNGVIWDLDTQSWIRENGLAAALKGEGGDIRLWALSGGPHTYLCPFTKQWQEKVAEASFKQIAEHGLSGVYLDCLTATRGDRCYDPTHGHPVHGGSYYALGQHQMMVDQRLKTRAIDPGASFFPEQIGEWVMDVMDGYLTLDLTRFPTTGAQLLPLYTAVYHPYTINFGSDLGLAQERDFFAWQLGTLLTWGSQVLSSVGVAPEPKAGDPNSEMLREVVQAYYVAGQRFLQGGRKLPLAVRPLAGAPGRGGLELATAPCHVAYQYDPRYLRSWTGPAVMASAWERQGDRAVVMVNITDQPQTVELTVRPAALGLAAGTKLLQTWPQPARELGEASGTHRLTLEPGKVALWVLTPNPARARQTRPLLETPWELLTQSSGEAFAPLSAAAGSLWACSDGPVQLATAGGQLSAQPLWWSEAGQLSPRRGREAAVTGPKAEGKALPRLTAEKPFLLLRRLNVTTTGTGNATVFAGADNHLSAAVEGPLTLNFPAPGLLVMTDLASGQLLQPLGQGQKLTVAAGRRALVGYARPETGDLARGLNLADKASQVRAGGVIAAVRTLQQQPTDRNLALATQRLAELGGNLHSLPGAWVPGRPLEQLTQQLQALAAARAGVVVALHSEHDWLAAGISKPLTAVLWGRKDTREAVARVELTPLGDWSQGAMQVSPATGVVPGGQAETKRLAGSVLLRDGLYVERLVPVLGACGVTVGGQRLTLSALDYLEANRPFEIQGARQPLTLIAGQGGQTTITLRNWSPYDLSFDLRGEGPAGWQITPVETAPAKVPAATNGQAAFRLQIPAQARPGDYTVKLLAGPKTDAQHRDAIAVLPVSLLPQLAPLVPEAAQWTPPPADQLARIRQAGKLLLFAQAGQPATINLNNVRVTIYTNTLKYRLLGPDQSEVKAGNVAVDKSETLSFTPALSGVYTLALEPGQGSATVETSLRPVAELATRKDPLQLFGCPLTRYFYVPAGSRGFRLGAQDGGIDERARFTVISPTGRVAYDYYGNFNSNESEIAVQPEEAGKVWTLQIKPDQDVSLWLAGDVCPYLSTDPQRVLREVGP
jgi:hypothetical protein